MFKHKDDTVFASFFSFTVTVGCLATNAYFRTLPTYTSIQCKKCSASFLQPSVNMNVHWVYVYVWCERCNVPEVIRNKKKRRKTSIYTCLHFVMLMCVLIEHQKDSHQIKIWTDEIQNESKEFLILNTTKGYAKVTNRQRKMAIKKTKAAFEC